mgnify:CR=1 FL=1
MPQILPCEEDIVKVILYSGVKFNDVSDYTCRCIRSFQETSYEQRQKLIHKHNRSLSLEDCLWLCCKEYEEAPLLKKRRIDRKVLGLIRRCCKGSLMFVRHYYKKYKEMKQGQFYVEDKDEYLFEK